VRFTLSQQQYDYVEDNFKLFGRSDLGTGKVLIRISPNTLWRSPEYDAFDAQTAGLHGRIPQFYKVKSSVAYRV